MISLTDVDPWLTHRVADWAVLLGVHQHTPRKVHGFVTSDERMLNLTRTLPVLMQTELTLFVCAGVGDDPVAATGLLLLHLPDVARHWSAHAAVYVVRPPAMKANELSKLLEAVAHRQGVTSQTLRRRFELTREQLTTPIKEWYVPGTP